MTDEPRRRRVTAAIAVAAAVGIVIATVALVRRDGTSVVTSDSTTTSTTSTSPTAPSTPSTPSTTGPSTTKPSTPPTTTTAPASGPAVAIRRGDTSRPLVALTFDAGSDLGYANEILDTLQAYGIRATFGMTGKWAAEHPDVVRRMVAEGHLLVNHSYDHPSFTGASTSTAALSQAARLDQLARAEAAVQAAAGVSMLPWFRPPYGDEDASVRADVALAGYRYEVMWTVDSLGWEGVSADEVVQRCLDNAGNGVIYLMHVGATSTDAAALTRVIDGLRARGFGFATVAELV